MRILIVPFAAAAIFAVANYSASAMSMSEANGLYAGDQAALAWHQLHKAATEAKADNGQ